MPVWVPSWPVFAVGNAFSLELRTGSSSVAAWAAIPAYSRHAPKFEHELQLNRLHGPCLIYAPAVPGSAVSDALASELDLLPTIAGFNSTQHLNSTMGREKERIAPTPCSRGSPPRARRPTWRTPIPGSRATGKRSAGPTTRPRGISPTTIHRTGSRPTPRRRFRKLETPAASRRLHGVDPVLDLRRPTPADSFDRHPFGQVDLHQALVWHVLLIGEPLEFGE